MNGFRTPILMILFRRHASLAAQIDILRTLHPARLYVFADGPRHAADDADCQRARAALAGIDWPCDLRRKFMETNLGCGKGPATAMDWFFEHEPEGIILEDDLLPHPDFFQFCAELLGRYRDDPRVMEISGTNRLGQWAAGERSYCFSQWGSECGWATWRRAWQHFDYTVRAWANPAARTRLRPVLRHPMRIAFLSRILNRTLQNPAAVTWWDYQWAFAKMLNGGLAAVPSVNLVRNVGCDSCSHHDRDATHTFAVENKLEGIAFPLQHPAEPGPDRAYDAALLREAITVRHCLSSLIPAPMKQLLKKRLRPAWDNPS
jgi:hypothetical protein